MPPVTLKNTRFLLICVIRVVVCEYMSQLHYFSCVRCFFIDYMLYLFELCTDTHWYGWSQNILFVSQNCNGRSDLVRCGFVGVAAPAPRARAIATGCLSRYRRGNRIARWGFFFFCRRPHISRFSKICFRPIHSAPHCDSGFNGLVSNNEKIKIVGVGPLALRILSRVLFSFLQLFCDGRLTDLKSDDLNFVRFQTEPLSDFRSDVPFFRRPI